MILTALILGLVSSLHCLGMCGPIALALPLDRSSQWSAASGALTYNGGRILTYMLLGVVFSMLGKAFSLIGIQQWVSVGAGVLMLLYVLATYVLNKGVYRPKGWTAGLNRLKAPMMRRMKERSMSSLFIIGLLNGLLPCGVLYFALIGAIGIGEPLRGGAYMLAFGLGTTPMLLAINMASSRLSSGWRKRFLGMTPLIMTVFGLLFILRGLSLGIPYISPILDASGATASCCH